MAMKRTDSSLTSLQRFEVWFGRNAVKVFLACITVVFLSIITVLKTVTGTTGERKVFLRLLDRATKYAIIATPDGRIIQVEKKVIPASVLRKYVRSVVMNYFVLDSSAFIDYKGNVISVKNPNDLGNFLRTLDTHSPAVKRLTNFFEAPVKGKPIPQSTKTLYAYLRYLYGLFQSGALPDIISPTGYVESEKFQTDGNTFQYSITFPVRFSFVGIDQKWHAGKGNISIAFSGYFNPLNATILNPYGMKVVKMTRPSYVVVE